MNDPFDLASSNIPTSPERESVRPGEVLSVISIVYADGSEVDLSPFELKRLGIFMILDRSQPGCLQLRFDVFRTIFRMIQVFYALKGMFGRRHDLDTYLFPVAFFRCDNPEFPIVRVSPFVRLTRSLRIGGFLARGSFELTKASVYDIDAQRSNPAPIAVDADFAERYNNGGLGSCVCGFTCDLGSRELFEHVKACAVQKAAVEKWQSEQAVMQSEAKT